MIFSAPATDKPQLSDADAASSVFVWSATTDERQLTSFAIVHWRRNDWMSEEIET